MKLLLALALSASPSPSPDARAQQVWREYCSLLKGCGLVAPAGACTDAQAGGVSGVRYDEQRCGEPRILSARGVSLGGPLGFRIYRFLGRRYRVVYPLEGELPLSAPRLSFLLDDLPLAAKLLTHYQKTRYTAEMLGSNRFRAGRGSGLSADAYLISGGTGERLLYYLGSGVSHIGPWKLRGQALLRVEYWPTGNGLGYRVRVVSSPSNAFLNTIMNLGLFKAVLRKRVREVLEDITEASRKLQRDGGRSVANRTDWTPQEKERITTLLRLP